MRCLTYSAYHICRILPRCRWSVKRLESEPSGDWPVMNAERLWLHYNFLPATKPTSGSRPALPPYVLLSEMLETCRSLAEVEATLARGERTAGMMLFAVDGKDESFAVYERDRATYRQRQAENGWLAGTNNPAGATAGEGDAYVTASRRRYERLAQLLPRAKASGQAGDVSGAFVRPLADPEVEGRGTGSGTVYANVACPSAGVLWYTFGGYPAASRGNWQRVAWPWQ